MPARNRSDRCKRNSNKKTQKKQKRYYSGKKKRHTLKAQVVINQKNGEILCIDYGKGSEHDFELYKRSSIKIRKEIKCIEDKKYQRIKKPYHFNEIPKIKPRKSKLSIVDKKENRKLAKKRIIIENVFTHLKRFRILQGEYQNKKND